jgi:hypothetical protein
MGRSILAQAITRRRFLVGSAATVGAAAVTMGVQCDASLIRRLQQARLAGAPRHVVWTWQFQNDGAPSQIAASLAPNQLAVAVKTHDGVDWMSTWDHSPFAVSGPGQVGALADYFERLNVPFHAWCVITGVDPLREAAMAAQVLAAGARSLILDLEGSSGFWAGSADDATRFCEELRRLSQYGRVDVSIDARPWRINRVPMDRFMPHIDGFWPQLYWDTFNNQPNIDAYRFSGYPPPGAGITPEFLLDTTYRLLSGYGRQVIPLGQGATADPATWPRFQQRAWQLGWGEIGVWRCGVTPLGTLQYLGQHPAGTPPPGVPPTTPTSTPPATPTTKPPPTRTATTRPATATFTPASTATQPPAATP